MKDRILRIDLSSEKYETEAVDFGPGSAYGRGLVAELLEKETPLTADRYDEENVIILAPGYLVGCKAPSATRMFVATLEGKGKGMQICNTTGNMPQKLGSLGYAAVIIRGRAKASNTVVHIDEEGASFARFPELESMRTGEMVSFLRKSYNRGSSIIGTCRSGDRKMSLSSFFMTYPEGAPGYHCPRGGFADILGDKRLRAVVVDSDSVFGRECADPDRLWDAGKRLTRAIVSDEVCGGALPGYGSITLLQILKSGKSLGKLSVTREKPIRFSDDEPMTPIRKKMEGINYTCAPMCVVGCLNRHASDGGHRYSSPAESEVNAALISCFGFSDPELASRIQHKATELGIISSEFVTSAKVYAEAVGITIAKEQGESTDNGAESDSAVPEYSSDEARADVHSSELLLDWLDEIDNGTVLGRVIASRTHGVASLYGEKDLRELLDRKAIQDEDRYNVRMSAMYPSLSHLSPLELLYDQIFVLENLGLCIFTSFALLDDPDCLDILAEQFEARSGVSATAEEMILYAGKCIENEKAFEFRRWRAAQKADIPQFTKVLYSYFDSKQHAQG